MPIHLRAEPDDYAPAVLVPGDPRRATYIAETFFDAGARCVNEERGELGYTGTFKGKPISVQSVGMGGASAAIYYTELTQQLGATRLIRVGTAGGLGDGTAHGRHRRRGQRHERRPDDRHLDRRRSARTDGRLAIGRAGRTARPRARRHGARRSHRLERRLLRHAAGSDEAVEGSPPPGRRDGGRHPVHAGGDHRLRGARQ